MRKRILLAAIAAIMGTAVSVAQQIAVVSESGATSVYQTLTEAIEGASNGSVIYLPGGGFQIHDSVKITKRLSIIGIGHKAKNENADGNTVISGNLFFNEGASGSSVMGCYISGAVQIANGGGRVDNIIVKLCNVHSVKIGNNLCVGTIINKCYVREDCELGASPVNLTNNVLDAIRNINGGTIVNNIIVGYVATFYDNSVRDVNNSNLTNNIIRYNVYASSGNVAVGNIFGSSTFGNDAISVDYGSLFVNSSPGVNPSADYHFNEDYQQYSDCGIYGGTGFSDGALPPVPFIVSKSIPEQTDASGKLNIKIRVKAGE